MNKKLPILIFFIVLIFFGFFGEVKAESVQFQTTLEYNLHAAAPIVGSPEYGKILNFDSSYYWISRPVIIINYNAQVLDSDTGANISSGSNIPVGKKITFHFVPHDYSDIYWFGTGWVLDSPYGDWSNNAEPSTPIRCEGKDYTSSLWWGGNPHGTSANGLYSLFFPLRVNPPSKTVTETNNLNCSSPKSNGDVECTVTNTGTVSAKMNFLDTFGYFYFRYAIDRKEYPQLCPTTSMFGQDYGGRCCQGSNTPLSLASGLTYKLSIPTSTISFSFNSTNGTVPTTPRITCPSSEAFIDQTKIFSFSSNVSDGKTVQYGIDTDDNGADLWVPDSGAGSGIIQSYSRYWITEGIKKIRVIAKDNENNLSAWSNVCTVNVTNNQICSDGSIIHKTSICPIPPTPISINARLTPNIVNRGSFCTATSTISNLTAGTTCNIYKTGQESIAYSDQNTSLNDPQLEPGFRYVYICKDSTTEVARSRELYCAANPSVLER